MIGDKIKVHENVKNLWETFSDKKKPLDIGLTEILRQMRTAHKQFFVGLQELHPELDEWELTYHPKDNTVVLVMKKGKGENHEKSTNL